MTQVENGIQPAGNAPDIEADGAMVVQSPTQSLRDLLNKARVSIEQALPKHLSVDRQIKVALVACSRTPKLLECSQRSILQSVMTASQLGLDCGGVLGSGYLVPYKGECQFIPGYRGLIDLARRSGQVGSIYAYSVFPGDVFEETFGTEPSIVHRRGNRQKGAELTHVYAVAKLKGGDTQFVVMTKDEVDAIRRRSKASSNGPWVTDYEQMALKTAVRRLCKWLPMSADLESALALTNIVEGDDPSAPLSLAGITEAPDSVPDTRLPGVFSPDEAAGAEPVGKAGAMARRLSADFQSGEVVASDGPAGSASVQDQPQPDAPQAVSGGQEPSAVEKAAREIDAARRGHSASGGGGRGRGRRSQPAPDPLSASGGGPVEPDAGVPDDILDGLGQS